jgi:hypothetical protein
MRMHKAVSVSLLTGGCAIALAACGSTSTPNAALAKSDVTLKLAQCMRTHGVPNFPDPSPGGGLQISWASGINPASPAFLSAQEACRRYAPPGAHGPGPMSAPERRHAVAFAECMRAHGEPDFPDPTIGAPTPSTTGRVLALRGMFFSVSPNFNPKTPGFRQAAAACGLRPPGS